MMWSVSVALLFGSVSAQDPATGWMAYAVGSLPFTVERITRLEMTWTVGENAKHSRSFYSPWFGMDPADNLNLIQPVNPWSGRSWSMYTEYYQWSPTYNSNSQQLSVSAGQTLHGSLVYNADDSYTLSQTVVETGATSSQVVQCQEGKKFTIPYVVYEKTFPCRTYPPDNSVTFRNIIVECDGSDCTQEVSWQAKVKDANCDMTAHVDSASLPTDSNEISITWNVNAASKYDNFTNAELLQLNAHGWAAKFAESADFVV